MAKQTKALAHPTGKAQSGAVTYKGATLAQYEQAGRWMHKGSLADGSAITVVHVTRRRYVVFNAKGAAIGYITASDPANAINRVEGNTLDTLRLH